SARLLETFHSQNRIAFEVGIHQGYVRNAGIAVAGLVETHLRSHRETALGVKNAVPLPATDQLIDDSRRTRADRFAIAERQGVAEIGIELVLQAVGSNTTAELRVVWVAQGGKFVIRGGTEDRGIEIDDLSPG